MDSHEAVIALRNAAESGGRWIVDTASARLSGVRPLRGTISMNPYGTINFRYRKDGVDEVMTSQTVIGITRE